MKGLYEEAMNVLYEGFNVESIKKRFDPNFMKRFMAERLLKEKNDRQEREKKEAERLAHKKVVLQKEEHESQKKRAEEDFENKKLIPILREAFDLVTTIEKQQKRARKQIN